MNYKNRKWRLTCTSRTVPVWLLITLERVLAKLVLHNRTVRSLEAEAIRLPCGATATLFTLPSCSRKRYALKFALKFQSMMQSSSPPLTICFMFGKNAALFMALRWPRKVRSRVGSMGIAEVLWVNCSCLQLLYFRLFNLV
jgi:hypothetical protein